MGLPKLLATARAERGFSQVDLAEKLELSPGTVAGWEAGDHGIHPKHIAKVAKVLGLDVDELLKANYVSRRETS